MKYIPVSYQVVCACCGKEFVAHRKNNVLCSRKCRDVWYKREKGQDSRLEPRHIVCAVCGKEFDTFNPSKKTCSDNCSCELKRRRDRKNRVYKEPLQKQCEICGESFETHQSCRRVCNKVECKKEYNKIRKYGQRQMVMRECKVCGTLFYCLEKETRVTCSHDCSVEWARQKRNLRADNRINKNNLVDYGITLEKIYARDSGICWICGGKCDWDDYQMREGVKICGKGYPSKDHVIPLARGGKHSWENVRLAHWWCNSVVKNDTTPTFTKEMSREQARKFAIERSTNKKKTAQYSLDGNLIRVWDSTAQIQRELGLCSKHIQNTCRRSTSNTGNAYGFHWEYLDG